MCISSHTQPAYLNNNYSSLFSVNHCFSAFHVTMNTYTIILKEFARRIHDHQNKMAIKGVVTTSAYLDTEQIKMIKDL